jgi:uncharacterized protein YndB with AHSA1/START domain
MESAKYTSPTRMPAKISPKVGGKWSTFDAMILGKNLLLTPGRRIVQTWRSSQWKKVDADSILVASFERSASGETRVRLVHVGMPRHDRDGVKRECVKY